jgi:adenylate kinase family enzyme
MVPSLRKIKNIHITGASGCGVTSLGISLASKLGRAHLDTDDYYWLPTTIPYSEKRTIPKRLELLRTSLGAAQDTGWILSGSLSGWGDPLIPHFDLVIFLTAPTDLRIERIRQRELQRFGEAALSRGGSRHELFQEFLSWATAYDEGSHAGRNRARHETWLAQLPCAVLRLDSSRATDYLVEEVIGQMN